MGENKVFTPEEVAERWGIPLRTVCQMLREQRLPGFKAGKHWRIAEESLLSYENTPGKRNKRSSPSSAMWRKVV